VLVIVVCKMWFVFEGAELVNQVGVFLAKAQGELFMVCAIWIVFKRAKAGKSDMVSR